MVLRSRLLAMALFAGMPVLAATALPVAAWAQSSPSPRAAIHDGFGRMVFDWPTGGTHDVEIVDGQLVLRFDRPAEGDFRSLLRPLAGYVRGVSVSEDRRTATFPLARPLGLRSFVTGQSVVVDLLDDPAAAPPRPQTLTVQAAQPVQPAAQQAPAPQPAPAETAPRIVVRAGEHAGFTRLVFDWTGPVEYQVEKEGDRALVTFDRPARIDAQGTRRDLPADISVLGSEEAGRGTRVSIAIPAETRLRHFRSGPKVVVDVVRPAAATPPPRPEGATPVPLAPPPGASEALPVVAPPPAAPAAKPEAPAVEQPAAPQPAAPAPAVRPEPVQVPQILPAALTPPAEEVDEPVPTTPTGPVVSLSFSWGEPAAAAAFRRAGWLWVVFDRRQDVDLRLLRRLGGDVVEHIEQVPHQGATAVRMITKPGYNPSLRREGLMWILDLWQQPLRPKEPIRIETPRDPPAGPRIFLPVAEGGSLITVDDPEVGDKIVVVPVLPLGQGVYPSQRTPELEMLVTAQGIAVVPTADGPEVRSSRSGVEISQRGGLMLSSEADKAAAQFQPSAEMGSGKLLDLGAWKRGGPDRVDEDRPVVHGLLTTVPADQRNDARLELARYYLANGYAAEALGVLRVMTLFDPQVSEMPAFRAALGAAEFMIGRYPEALNAFSHDGLQDVPEVQVWKALAEASMDTPGRFYEDMKDEGRRMILDYARPVKLPLALIMAEAAIEAADDLNARNLLGDIRDMAIDDPTAEAKLSWLQGRYDAMTGSFESAINHYKDAEEGPSRPHRAYAARDRVELQLRQGDMSVADAIQEFEKLRFAWRGPEFEFPLLKRLGELYMAEGDYPNAMRTLRQLASTFGDHRDVGQATQMMSRAFEDLYLHGQADSMAPVTAIALFDEFRELTPAGEKGDEMIRRLADRLASVDLLDRAADLLRHQVKFRLEGVEKARVGAQLALLELMDQQPERALATLDETDESGQPADLRAQRRQLRARALADMSAPGDAITMLAGDESFEGRLLKAEFEWRRQNWPAAAQALESLVQRPVRGEPLEEGQGRLVLDWATALALSGNERGLAGLRRVYGPLMQETRYRDAFNLLTAEIEQGLIDYRSVSDKIREAEAFQSFMASYRQRLRAEGLSAIN
ncbi:tetratricopeptide repeat protein [Telmatospirillum sp. J64-1]|uniref:tetratricopeptide repeat protein n=1 Tax=Telmatospirillum sp. J64-1 TaxID=2502183 RepID=UPI00115E6ACF|nr:tetratricopeptide repeat protein [Telmatospirillum sp. J64-1]